jgi:hypothetical protein
MLGMVTTCVSLYWRELTYGPCMSSTPVTVTVHLYTASAHMMDTHHEMCTPLRDAMQHCWVQFDVSSSVTIFGIVQIHGILKDVLIHGFILGSCRIHGFIQNIQGYFSEFLE